MAAYMHLSAVEEYTGTIIPENQIKMIDGSAWVPTDYIKTLMSPEDYREMQCEIITWVPDESITDEMREQHRMEKAMFELECGGYDDMMI